MWLLQISQYIQIFVLFTALQLHLLLPLIKLYWSWPIWNMHVQWVGEMARTWHSERNFHTLANWKQQNGTLKEISMHWQIGNNKMALWKKSPCIGKLEITKWNSKINFHALANWKQHGTVKETCADEHFFFHTQKMFYNFGSCYNQYLFLGFFLSGWKIKQTQMVVHAISCLSGCFLPIVEHFQAILATSSLIFGYKTSPTLAHGY